MANQVDSNNVLVEEVAAEAAVDVEKEMKKLRTIGILTIVGSIVLGAGLGIGGTLFAQKMGANTTPPPVGGDSFSCF